MRSLLRPLALLLCLSVAGGSVLAAKEEKDKPKSEKKKKDKSDKTAKKDAPKPSDPQDPKSGRLSLPLVPDHPSIGLKIPYYDTTGRLQMNFVIGVATRLDADRVEMKEANVETFNEEGETEMQIDLPVSVLDLNTRVITSQTKTTIRRSDFVITGDSVAFNTATKQGKLIGNVHMTIYDLQEEGIAPNEKPAHETEEPRTP